MSYWRFLLRPWKVGTFVLATAALAGMAPYTGDPTWDYADSVIMATLTFLTAPWALRVLWRREGWTMLPALVAWYVSASLSYDLYLLWRDGYYPVLWFENLVCSGFLYLCGGLIWNLEWRPGRGYTFAFLEPTAAASRGSAPTPPPPASSR